MALPDFDTFAQQYAFVNRFTSIGIDGWWRRLLSRAVASIRPRLVLDIATGTGQTAFAIARACPQAIIYGIDISEKMLRIARAQNPAPARIHFQQGDVHHLPFRDEQFDVVTCAFGLRNFRAWRQALAEVGRVLRAGGYFFVLEFGLWRTLPWFIRWYLRGVLPVVGAYLTGILESYGFLVGSAWSFVPWSVVGKMPWFRECFRLGLTSQITWLLGFQKTFH